MFDEESKATIDIGDTVYHLAYTKEEGLALEGMEKKERE